MTRFLSPVPEPARGVRSPGISREIYGMPAFATLISPDPDATIAWYTEALDFVVLFAIPGHGGKPLLVHLRRWHFQDLLVRPAHGPVVAGSSATLTFAAVYDEIAPLAERARAHGGGEAGHPVDTPWNTRELTTTDPDGNVVIFSAGRPPEEADAGFSARIGQWSAEQG